MGVLLKPGEFIMLHDLAHEMEKTLGAVNISELARITGFDRRTISKYLALERLPVFQKRKKRPSKLDDYKEYIAQRLNDCPDISAARIFQDIMKMGFSGKYTIVKDFVRRVRP